MLSCPSTYIGPYPILILTLWDDPAAYPRTMGLCGSAQVQGPARQLLLGPGGAGKSTLFKQIKLRYASGFSEAELAEGARGVRTALLLTMRLLVRHEAIVARSFPPRLPPSLFLPHVREAEHLSNSVLCVRIVRVRVRVRIRISCSPR